MMSFPRLFGPCSFEPFVLGLSKHERRSDAPFDRSTGSRFRVNGDSLSEKYNLSTHLGKISLHRLFRKGELLVRYLFLPVLLFLLSGVANALPSYDEVRKSFVKSDSLLLDRRGEILHELRVDKDRRRLDWTSLGGISPKFQDAVIQAEDKRFYAHRGVDYKSMGAALLKGLTSENLRGASTITMQLSSLLDGEITPRRVRKSLWQKWGQILRAWEIEKRWSKKEILEAYLNLVTFRGELQGIAAASRGLFSKDPHGLDQSESLILSSLIRSPNASSQEVIQRACRLNQSMNWHIDKDELDAKVKQVFFGSNFLRPRSDLAPHVARQLFKGRPIESTVMSTLDSTIQRFALDRLTHHLISSKSQNVKDGAILVLENHTGEVLAYGSHSGEPLQGRFVDGVQAKRQAGSTLKPFLYALAFDRRILTPASILDDTPLDIAVLRGVYQPRNYDSGYRGLVTARTALASSLNVPAVKALSLVGSEAFLNRLRQMGIKGLNESGDFYGPALALGSADVTLWELTNAYRTFAQGGEWGEAYLLLKSKKASSTLQIFSKEAASLISDILSDRDARSVTFGFENPLATRFWTAVKTGTSKDMRDNWCVGYSNRYTVGVWVGNFSGEPMWNVSGTTGAAPVWIEVMNFLHRNDLSPRRELPVFLLKKRVEFSHGIDPPREEWFIRDTEPDSRDQKIGQFHQRVLYPPAGTVIALDPDIPPERQKVLFVAQTGGEGFHWILNGMKMEGGGKTIPWSPKPGKYLLEIRDRGERIIDSVYFEVRGDERD